MNALNASALLLCLAALPAGAAPAPMASVPAAAAAADPQQAAFAALGRLSTVPPGPLVHPWKSVTCGAALWKRLVARDPSLANRGVAAQLGKPGQPPAGEARSFSPSKEDSWLYKSAAMQQLAKSFAAGRARPAAPAEREAFAALVPFEVGARPVTIVEAAGEAILVYSDPDAELLWLDLVAPGKADAKAGVAASSATAAAAPAAPTATPETVYPVSDLRDPFLTLAAGGSAPTASAAQCAPGEFSVHSLALRGIMKDRAVEYAVFSHDVCKQSFVLRYGKLYDDRGKAVPGITGGLNLRQKSAHLKSAEGDVQIFRLGEPLDQTQ